MIYSKVVSELIKFHSFNEGSFTLGHGYSYQASYYVRCKIKTMDPIEIVRNVIPWIFISVEGSSF